MGCSKSSANREVYTKTSPPQETREPSNKQSNFALKQQKRRTQPPKVSRRKEIINIRTEINEKEMKEAMAAAAAKSLQLWPTLCNPIDGSPPGSSVAGILQARTLEWVAISFSSA